MPLGAGATTSSVPWYSSAKLAGASVVGVVDEPMGWPGGRGDHRERGSLARSAERSVGADARIGRLRITLRHLQPEDLSGFQGSF